jgi:hypothetical protein
MTSLTWLTGRVILVILVKHPETSPLSNMLEPLHPIERKRNAPAERAGIKVEGENKWLTLIQNASRINVDTEVGADA